MSISVTAHQDQRLVDMMRNLALEGYRAPGKQEFAGKDKYFWLRKIGSRLWLDTGDARAADKVWGAEIDALTTNNTLINQVVQTGEMDGLITYAAGKLWELHPELPEADMIMEIGFLVNARVALGLVEKFGAHVSVELHPDLGFDVGRTVAFARRYYQINPDYFYVKVPMTPDGFISVRHLTREGIPINYTLGFSARQNFLATRFSRPRFVNVFLGRLNSLVEENNLGTPENVGEKAALASYEHVKKLRDADREIMTEQIAASMRSGKQIVSLAGVDVLTMPPKAVQEYLEMDVTEQDIRQRRSQDLDVELSESIAQRLSRMWEIDQRFEAFVDEAVRQADTMTRGQDLVDMSRRHGVELFGDWSTEDRAKLREKGKIPDLEQWPQAPLDDLLSMSALESFAKDQTELDGRIRELIHTK